MDLIRDQNVMSRRKAMMLGAKGALAASVFPSIARAVTASPPEEEGPYFIEEKLKRSDIRTSSTAGGTMAGVPLYLAIGVSKIVNNVLVPFGGAYVDIWQCNAVGVYSDESAEGTTGQNWLRGYQVTTSHGIVKFTTIYPGFYGGRATHIHCRVRAFSGTTTTFNYETQLFLNDTMSTSIYKNAPYTSDKNQRTYNTADRAYNTSFTDTNGTTVSPSGPAVTLTLAQSTSKVVGSINLKLRPS